MFTAILFTITNQWVQPKYLSMDDQVKKVGHTYSGIKKKDILPFRTAWKGLEGTVLSEINLPEKDKYCVTSLTCGI